MTRRKGLYSADLITEVIEDAVELYEELKSNQIHSKVWLQIGAEIRKMHNLNVCHEDINVKNILLQKQNSNVQIYLIDFDKCSIKKNGNWKEANLARFKRSLLKHQSTYVDGAFTETSWQALLTGYQSH